MTASTEEIVINDDTKEEKVVGFHEFGLDDRILKVKRKNLQLLSNSID